MSDSATTAWVSAVVSAGGTVSAGREAHVDALVVGLKSDGVWAKLDRLWLFAAENTQSALIDLVALDTATAVNSPSFAVDQGYTGNGTNSYINTTYRPGTDGTNWTGNAASFGFWQSSLPAARNEVQMGANYFGHPSQIANFFGDTNNYNQVNCSTSLAVSGTAVRGLYCSDRSGASLTTFYLNGVASGTSTATATAETDCNMFILGRNDNSGSDSLTNPSTAQISAAYLGGSLGASDQADLYNRLNTYMAFAGQWTQRGPPFAIEVISSSATGTVSSTINVPLHTTLAVVGISGFNGDVDGFSAGGLTLTKSGTDTAMVSSGTFGDNSTSAWQAAMYYMVLPDIGPSSLKWNWVNGTSAHDHIIFSLSFWSGVDTASPVRDADGTQHTGGPPWTTPTLTAQTGDKIIAWFGGYVGSGDGTVDTWDNATELAEFVLDNEDGALATANPTGNQTVGISAVTGFTEGGLIATVFKAPAGASEELVTVDKADITFTGQSVAVSDVIAVDQDNVGEIRLNGQVVQFADTLGITPGTLTLAGDTVTVVTNIPTIPVTQSTFDFLGQDVTTFDTAPGANPVENSTLTLAGQDVSVLEILGLVPVDNGTITFAGQDVAITNTGEVQRGYTKPFEDFGRAQRRRMRALEPILERRRKKIRELERQAEKKAEELRKTKIQPTFPDKQEKVADLSHELDQIKMHLLGMQMRAETARQELMQLQAMQSALEEDEEEAIVALLLH